MSSTWETFFSATVILASTGPIKQRLTQAYARHLAKVAESDLPKELRDDYVALERSLSSVRPMRGETAVQATVRKMSDEEAGRYAEKIVTLFGMMTRLQSQQRMPMLRAVGMGDEVADRA